jgi:hypothetical protein
VQIECASEFPFPATNAIRRTTVADEEVFPESAISPLKTSLFPVEDVTRSPASAPSVNANGTSI